MSTYSYAIEKKVIVVKKKVGVGHQIIIKMNTHFIKQDSPDGFDNISVFKELRQAVGHVSEVGSSICKSCYCNNDTETWKI